MAICVVAIKGHKPEGSTLGRSPFVPLILSHPASWHNARGFPPCSRDTAMMRVVSITRVGVVAIWDRCLMWSLQTSGHLYSYISTDTTYTQHSMHWDRQVVCTISSYPSLICMYRERQVVLHYTPVWSFTYTKYFSPLAGLKSRDPRRMVSSYTQNLQMAFHDYLFMFWLNHFRLISKSE